ncbi:hypothetical protein VC178_01545 [Polynucleobacter sp. AP-Sanab-80-C2]|nr:hypothetical protein [Polynucleobacter sp. AP-Sanab-80-C2]
MGLGACAKYGFRLDHHQEFLKYCLQNDYVISIANTRLVASRAILANCDVKASNPQSSEIDLEFLDAAAHRVNALHDLGRPVSIYICSDALPYFSKYVLPAIQIPFVLVSGDSDLSISVQTLGPTLKAIADHSLLIAWFAQNKDSEHTKLRALPIGLDFHSRWRDAQIWGGGFILPAMQEAELRQILQQSPRWSERKVLAYCNWGVSVDRGDRQECKQKMNPQAYFYQSKRLSRTQTWVEQAQYAFVISPSGAGLDCHRTWEALALGCVPIVKRSPMGEVFEGLPVLMVDDWAQVSPLFLKEQAERLQGQTMDYSRLLLRHWIGQINLNSANQVFAPVRCTLDQMKEIVL